MSPEQEKAFEDQLDGSDWRVPPKPDSVVIAELREALHTAECLLDDCAQVWEGGTMPAERRIKSVLVSIATILRPASPT